MEIFKKHIIGLEMDSKEIRAVEITGNKKNPAISAWGRIDLPEGAVKEGKVADPDLLSECIVKLMGQNKFRGKNVVLGVNNQDIIVRFATFPKVPDDKIRSMVRMQAEDYIPVPLAELEVDYIVTGEKESEDRKFINVILVGARKKMIGDYIKSIERAGLNITDIDSTMFALGRSSLIFSNTGNFAVVGFNNDLGNIMIFNNGILEFVRTVAISNTTEEGNVSGADLISNILINEIRSSVNYYLSKNSVEIMKIFICGTDKNQEAVASQIRKITNIQVEIPDPYRTLKISGMNGAMGIDISNYNACISLALKGMGE